MRGVLSGGVGEAPSWAALVGHRGGGPGREAGVTWSGGAEEWRHVAVAAPVDGTACLGPQQSVWDPGRLVNSAPTTAAS